MKQIPLIEGNELHNKVAIATMAFGRILEDSPQIDVAWARDAALRIAKIKPLCDAVAFANFTEQVHKILVNRELHRSLISEIK